MIRKLFLIIFMICMASIFFGCSLDNEQPKEYIEYNIYSLKVQNEMIGDGAMAFSIGYANIGERTYYYFYRQQEEGVILDKVNAEYTKIVETDEIIPKYRIYNYFITNKTDTLYVPKGTIKYEYKIN